MLVSIFVFIEWGVLYTEKSSPTFSVCGSGPHARHLHMCQLSSSYLVVSRVWNKPCDLLSRSPNLPDKKHFEPF